MRYSNCVYTSSVALRSDQILALYDRPLSRMRARIFKFGTLGPGVWRRRFPWVFAYKSWWCNHCRTHTAEKSFGLSTGRLAGRNHAEELWPLNRTIERSERRIPAGICHRRCRIGRMGLCFDREFEFGVFMMGMWLKIAYYRCIPATYRK